jgi:cation:H+ antiporter
MLTQLLLLILGLTGLWFGSERVVSGGKAIAKRLGVSQLLIGLTIVSIGTSLPEIMVTSYSGIRGTADIAIGAMVGSCLTQITLILGIAGIIHNIKVRKKALAVDGRMLIASISLFSFFLWTGMRLTPFEGLILIAVYGAYIWYTFSHDELKAEAKDKGKHKRKGHSLWLRIGEILVGVAVLIFSGELVLDSAIFIAKANGLSEAFIGVVLVGAATGLPELSTAVMGAIKKAPGISIGTLIGSNITDPLLSLGIGSLFGGFATNPELLYFDIPFWFIASIIALMLLHSDRLTLNKYDGVALVLVYGIFLMTKISFL